MNRPKARPVCTYCGGCRKTNSSPYCDKKPFNYLATIWLLSIFCLCGLIWLIVEAYNIPANHISNNKALGCSIIVLEDVIKNA